MYAIDDNKLRIFKFQDSYCDDLRGTTFKGIR